MSPGPEKQHGFTLLEVLLAIALFAMLSLLTAQMLTTTIDSNEQTKKHQQRFSAIVRTVNLLDKDIRQRVPVTQLQGEKETLMLTTASSNSYPGACCEFSGICRIILYTARSGATRKMQPRPSLSRCSMV